MYKLKVLKARIDEIVEVMKGTMTPADRFARDKELKEKNEKYIRIR